MRTLMELMAHIDGIYAARNALVRSDLSDRIRFLNISVGKLHRSYRKGKTEEIGVRLANMFSRICCVAEGFRGNLGLLSMLERKYPESYCSYCHKKPCECEYRERNPSVLSQQRTCQINWSLSEWQLHFAEVYGAKNNSADRGPHVVLLQIYSEVTELLEVAEEAHVYSISGLTQLFAEELSDVFAWMLGFANLMGVKLEEKVEEIYGVGCPACHQPRCACPIHGNKDKAYTTTSMY